MRPTWEFGAQKAEGYLQLARVENKQLSVLEAVETGAVEAGGGRAERKRVSELHNPQYEGPRLHTIRRSPKLKAQKLWEGRSGSCWSRYWGKEVKKKVTLKLTQATGDN